MEVIWSWKFFFPFARPKTPTRDAETSSEQEKEPLYVLCLCSSRRISGIHDHSPGSQPPMSIIQREHTYSSAKWEATAGYSRAVKMGPFIYVAGTTATDPVTGKIVGPNDVYAQSVQIWENISAALGRLGASLKNVVRTRMFVVDIHTNGPKVAEAHAKYFMDVRPASTMLGIPALYTPDMLVEFGTIGLLYQIGSPSSLSDSPAFNLGFFLASPSLSGYHFIYRRPHTAFRCGGPCV